MTKRAAVDAARHFHGHIGTGSAFNLASTRGEPRRHRFDYWRSLHPHIHIDAINKASWTDFHAERLSYEAPDGSRFGMTTNDDVAAHFAKQESDFALFSLTVAGSARMTLPRGVERVVSPHDGLVVLDSRDAVTTESRNHEHVYLTVPRARVANLLDSNGNILRGGLVLPMSGIPALLTSHLLAIAKEATRLDTTAASTAVKCGVDLAIGALTQACDLSSSGGNSHASYYAAARRLIALHFNDSSLTTEEIAQRIGCSRAHLHRVFSEKGEQAGDVIRTARLTAARELLESSSRLSVKQVAHACGFDNASAFTRAYRQFYGITPSAFREMNVLQSEGQRSGNY